MGRALSPEDEDQTGPGIYDPDPAAEADLWFLPAEAEPDATAPGTLPDRRRLFDPTPWGAAQDRHSAALAELACLFGALDERLRAGSEGWRHRLALTEVFDLGWWTGDRFGLDRLALWVGLRIGATGDEAGAMARAGWAVRRLTGGPGPAEGGWLVGLAGFLGRGGVAETTPDAIADLADIMDQAASLHPITQAAMLFHGWRMLAAERSGPAGLTQSASADMEAAIMAARHAATMGRGGAVFLPLALTGPTALRATGDETQRLSGWIAGATQAVLAALLQLDRVHDWEDRARAGTADLSGRTPPALITSLAAWPLLSAPLAEQITGASRAAVQRNMTMLEQRALVREVTGQGRFRFWKAST